MNTNKLTPPVQGITNNIQSSEEKPSEGLRLSNVGAPVSPLTPNFEFKKKKLF